VSVFSYSIKFVILPFQKIIEHHSVPQTDISRETGSQHKSRQSCYCVFDQMKPTHGGPIFFCFQTM